MHCSDTQTVHTMASVVISIYSASVECKDSTVFWEICVSVYVCVSRQAETTSSIQTLKYQNMWASYELEKLSFKVLQGKFHSREKACKRTASLCMVHCCDIQTVHMLASVNCHITQHLWNTKTLSETHLEIILLVLT